MTGGRVAKRIKDSLLYILVTVSFFVYLFVFHPKVFSYKMPDTLTGDYLRSQDIEDPKGLIHDRIFISDSDIYIASGYLYATGTEPTKYNFQHPPLIKYLFGFSTVLTGNPFYAQIVFGLGLLLVTYFLGRKLFKGPLVALGAVFLLLIDPVFSGTMEGALLDLGQAFFALGYVALTFFFPEKWILQGVALGGFAASKFWSTAIIIVFLIYVFKIFFLKEKINWRKVLGSFAAASAVFFLTYTVSFIEAGGMFNIFELQGRVLKFMLTHNSAVSVGGPIALFVSGYFAPWWQGGMARSADWSLFWPLGLISGIFLALRAKAGDPKTFCYLVPAAYLLLSAAQVPFTRYFIIILPFAYLNFANLFMQWYYSIRVTRKNQRSRIARSS